MSAGGVRSSRAKNGGQGVGGAAVLAHDDGGDALAHGGERVAVAEDLPVGVAVGVDEARREHEAGAVHDTVAGLPAGASPTATMRSPAIRTLAARGAAPVPSMIVALTISVGGPATGVVLVLEGAEHPAATNAGRIARAVALGRRRTVLMVDCSIRIAVRGVGCRAGQAS